MTDVQQLEIPSGPPAKVPRAKANTYAAYLAWRKTTDGARVWEAIQVIALDQLRRGCQRVSTKAIVEQVRAALVPKVDINNSWTSFLADDLVYRYKALGDVIERRRRKVRP